MTKNNPNEPTDGDHPVALTSQNRDGGELAQERLATEENMGAEGNFAVGGVNRLPRDGNSASRNRNELDRGHSRTGFGF